MKGILINAALVGSGGFLGAVCRYGMQSLFQRNIAVAAIPYGTLAVNLVGCLLIGFVFGLMEARQVFSLEFRLFVLVGLLGGFTTYSTFGYETFALLKDGELFRAVANVIIQVILGIALVWAGYALASE